MWCSENRRPDFRETLNKSIQAPLNGVSSRRGIDGCAFIQRFPRNPPQGLDQAYKQPRNEKMPGTQPKEAAMSSGITHFTAYFSMNQQKYPTR